jgi:hypothetical protein
VTPREPREASGCLGYAARGAGAQALGRGRRSRGAHLRRELPTEQVEIGQGEGREEAGGVLGQPAVAHLREAPEPLHHVKRVLAAGPRLRALPVGASLRGGQRPLVRAAAVDAVPDAVGGGALAVKLAPIRLVGVECLLLAVQELRQARDWPRAPPSSSNCARCRAGRSRRGLSCRSAKSSPSWSDASRGRASWRHSWSTAAPR